MVLEERCLKKISIAVDNDSALFHGLNQLQEIELWNSKSKIVNENIRNISRPLKFISLVNPVYTPIWAIVDKPYIVFSSDENTLSVFQTLMNHSNLKENVFNNALLASIKDTLFMMFYIEMVNESPCVKCLLLEINFNKIDEILNEEEAMSTDSPSAYFIDEVLAKKDEMIDNLLKRRSDKQQLSRAKKQQVEDTAKDQQFRIVNVRQNFKKIINKEVKRRLTGRPKSTQIEAGEICFKAMSFKFTSLESMDDRDEREVKDWLNIFLSVLGL